MLEHAPTFMLFSMFHFSSVVFVMAVQRQPELVQGVPVPMFSTFTTCTFIGHGIANIMFGVIQAANATVRLVAVFVSHESEDEKLVFTIAPCYRVDGKGHSEVES